MKKVNIAKTLESFNKLDLYDDALKSISINPLNTERNLVKVQLELVDDGTGKEKWLTFFGCGNIRQNTDFDVVSNNSFALMERASASNDPSRKLQFVETQKSHWRTTYMPPSPKDFPIRKKLASLNSFVLFKIAFHGGTIELLARNFRLTSKKSKPSHQTRKH